MTPFPVPNFQELSRTPDPWYFLESNASTNGRRTAVQMGGLKARKAQRYKWGGECFRATTKGQNRFLETLTSLKKEVRPVFLGDNSI